jgi:ketosteroid isomerase-like protein
MIRGRILWPLLALVVLLAACATQDAADYAEETAEVGAALILDAEAAAAVIDGIEQAFITAYDAEDAAGIAALFAADGTQAQPLGASLDVAGIEAAYAEQFAAGGDYSLEVMREDMVVADGWIVSWGGYVATVAAEGAEPFEVTGRYGSVNRQEADGTWKIYRHIFNYIVPPPGFGQEM